MLQAVFAKQKESYINQLTKADAARQELQKSMRQMEDQLVRATAEVQQRRQQAADKGEDVDRQLSLLRKVSQMLALLLPRSRDLKGSSLDRGVRRISPLWLGLGPLAARFA